MNYWFQESNPDHPHIDAAAAYVLGALEPEEHNDFERHVAACNDCRKEVTELYMVRQSLPAMLPQKTPSPRVHEAVMQQVQKEVTLFESAQLDEIFAPPRVWYRQRLAPSVAWAAICTALFLGLLGGGQFEHLLNPEGDDTQMVFATVNPQVAPMVQASLHTGGSDPGATLSLRRLPAQQAGQAYRVWIRESERSPLEPVVTKLRQTNKGVTQIFLGRDINDVSELVLTLETGEIGTVPNGKAVLSINLGEGPAGPVQAAPSA